MAIGNTTRRAVFYCGKLIVVFLQLQTVHLFRTPIVHVSLRLESLVTLSCKLTDRHLMRIWHMSDVMQTIIE
jgi:hypothetical protein